MPLRHDTYYRYDELTAILQDMARTHPDLLSLSSLGQSYQGREIWCATVTRRDTGPDLEKPAVWVDGNIHSVEVSASSACLYLLDALLGRYGSDPAITRAVDSRAFYVVPRVNPDGVELALAERPRYLRSSVRPYPYDEEPIEGLEKEDIDGDGRLLTMRLVDPNGPWKACEQDPRLLVRRQPTDLEGPFYRLLPEGRMVKGWDGVTLKVAPPRERLDLNRNFPVEWRTEGQQPGAGPFPTSEPEVRALVAFIASHPNICHAVTFHTYGGVLLRPYGTQADEAFPAEDLWLYQAIGRQGTRLTGYPAVSVYHDFKYHPKEVITGVFDDWMYDHFGVFAWTVELWCPQRQAGITEGFSPDGKDLKLIDWYREHPLEDDLKLLRWCDEKWGEKGFVPWRPFPHPDLGPVEIGGWDRMYCWWNPPPEALEKEIAPLADWILWQALSTPLLTLHSEEVVPVGPDAWRLRLVVQNSGWLATNVSQKALERKACRPVLAEIDLSPGMELISGRAREELGQLAGVAHKPTAYLGQGSDPSDDRGKVEWVVRGSGQATVTVRHERAGRLVRTYRLS
jgi:murein tripeptide amidase MpaA